MTIISLLYMVSIILVVVIVIMGISHTINEYNKEFGANHVTDIHYDPKHEVLQFKGGRSGTSYAYRGSCTVWFHMDGTRCHTTLEMSLSEIWHKWKYEQKD